MIEKEIWGERNEKGKLNEREKGYKMERERMRDRYGKRESGTEKERNMYKRKKESE